MSINRFIKYLLFILSSFLLLSCGGEKATSKLSVSISAISAAGVNMPGGMLLYGFNKTDATKTSIKFEDGQNEILLENGEWDILIIGWNGLSNMEGIVECGGTSVTLDGGEAEIDISVSNSNCFDTEIAKPDYIGLNPFSNINLMSCAQIPSTISIGTNCSTSPGNIGSYKVSLLTSNSVGEDLPVEGKLESQCYDIESGFNTSLNIPLGGSPLSPIHSQIQVFENKGCSGLTELFELPYGIADDTSVVTQSNTSIYKYFSDSIVANIFIESDFFPTIGTPTDLFISEWNISTASEVITLPLVSGLNYDFTVDWGDGSAIEAHTTDIPLSHTYETVGVYTVTIQGLLEGWSFNGSTDASKLISVLNFGDMGWINLYGAFKGCTNLLSFQGGDLSHVTNMQSMFEAALNVTPDVSNWDTSSVTDMSKMFDGASFADPDVSGWDTSSVTDMSNMFNGAIAANPNVSSWNFSSTLLMDGMFIGSALSSENYDILLQTIDFTSNQTGISIDINAISHSTAASAAYLSLTLFKGWTINGIDGGPNPMITATDITSGGYEGGTTITLAGQNFIDGIEIMINSVPCTSLTVISDTSLTCETGNNSVSGGPYDIELTSIFGSDTLPASFTYDP